MKCAEFERRLHELLDQRIQPESDFQLFHHAQQCSRCRRSLNGVATLLSGIDLLDVPSLPADFTQQTVAKVQPQRASHGFVTWTVGAVYCAHS